jgi:hypothetical protein
MSSICFLTIDLKRAAWRAKRVVAATVLEISSFRYPGSKEVLAQPKGQSLSYIRVRIERVLRGDGLEVGKELRVFSHLQWYRHTHASLLRDNVISHAEEHYTGGIPLEEIRAGDGIVFFLDDQPAPKKFPRGSIFMSFEEAYDRGAREAEVLTALKDGPYGGYHQLLKIPKNGRMRLPDDLEIVFLGHSHKRPTVDGPRKEWVDLKLTLGESKETITLDHDTDADGQQTWEHRDWNGYKVEAHGMNTEEATIVVRKL